MKTLGIVLIVAGVVSFALPVIGFLVKGKPPEASAGKVVEKRMDPLSLGPMVGVMFLSVGGGILVARVITGKN